VSVERELPPPVPPEEYGGDQRIGWWITGTLCILAGWVGAVLGNLALHRLAPSGGWHFGPFWIGPSMGPYAWALLGIGVGVGIFGVVLFHLARRSAPGRFVLPGYPY
jgi:hypothetical protein